MLNVFLLISWAKNLQQNKIINKQINGNIREN